MRFTIDGKPVEASDDIPTSLLDLLRDRLGLVSARNVCNQGACSAYIVPVDGERVNSGLALPVPYRDRNIVTVEPLRGTTRDASQPGLGSLLPRLETTSL